MNLKEMTDEQLEEAARNFMAERAELKSKAMSIQDEMDRRAVLRKLADVDPKGVVIKARSIPSDEAVGMPDAT